MQKAAWTSVKTLPSPLSPSDSHPASRGGCGTDRSLYRFSNRTRQQPPAAVDRPATRRTGAEVPTLVNTTTTVMSPLSPRAVGVTHRGQPYSSGSCTQQFRGTRACSRTGGTHIIHEQDAPVFGFLGSEDTPLGTTPGVPSPTRLRTMHHASQRSCMGDAEGAGHATAQTLPLIKAALQSPPRMHRDRHDDIHAWDPSRQDLAEGISKGIDQQGVGAIF